MIAKEKEFVETQAKKGVDIKPVAALAHPEESKQGGDAAAGEQIVDNQQ